MDVVITTELKKKKTSLNLISDVSGCLYVACGSHDSVCAIWFKPKTENAEMACLSISS